MCHNQWMGFRDSADQIANKNTWKHGRLKLFKNKYIPIITDDNVISVFCENGEKTTKKILQLFRRKWERGWSANQCCWTEKECNSESDTWTAISEWIRKAWATCTDQNYVPVRRDEYRTIFLEPVMKNDKRHMELVIQYYERSSTWGTFE